MATILVTGGTGFIGRNLCQRALDQGWQLIVLTRNVKAAAKKLPPAVQIIERLSDLKPDVAIEAVVNLAGQPLAEGRWTQARKQNFIDSRVGTTTDLYTFFSARDLKPSVLISGSAIGLLRAGRAFCG